MVGMRGGHSVWYPRDGYEIFLMLELTSQPVLIEVTIARDSLSSALSNSLPLPFLSCFVFLHFLFNSYCLNSSFVFLLLKFLPLFRDWRLSFFIWLFVTTSFLLPVVVPYFIPFFLFRVPLFLSFILFLFLSSLINFSYYNLFLAYSLFSWLLSFLYFFFSLSS